MNLQEAIKSGRPFKRPSFKRGYQGEPWLHVSQGRTAGQIEFVGTKAHWFPQAEDIEAQDWEIAPESFEERFRGAIKELDPNGYMRVFTDRLSEKLFSMEIPF